MAQWSTAVLEHYVATGITSFTDADVPDLRERFPQASHWIANHFLNSVLRTSFTGQIRQLVFGLLRRVFHAFQAYHEARELTLTYLHSVDPHKPNTTRYFNAVVAWEAYVLQVSMAVDILRRLQQKDVFSKNDGTALDRAYRIGNQVKHLSSCVVSGQMDDDHTQPLWLSNEGINSFDIAITYNEAGAILSEFADLADILQDPAAAIGTA